MLPRYWLSWLVSLCLGYKSRKYILIHKWVRNKPLKYHSGKPFTLYCPLSRWSFSGKGMFQPEYLIKCQIIFSLLKIWYYFSSLRVAACIIECNGGLKFWHLYSSKCLCVWALQGWFRQRRVSEGNWIIYRFNQITVFQQPKLREDTTHHGFISPSVFFESTGENRRTFTRQTGYDE